MLKHITLLLSKQDDKHYPSSDQSFITLSCIPSYYRQYPMVGVIKRPYQGFAERCTRAIRALTFHVRPMHTPLRSSLCGQPCHRSSMSRTAHNVFLIIVGIIIAQLWGVVRRLVVCAFKTHEKRSVFLSLSLLLSFWPSLFSSFTY